MTSEEKIEYLWEIHYHRALGCSHPSPIDYADRQVEPRRAELRRAERSQANGHLRVGSRAGRAQAAAKRSLRTVGS